MTMTTTQQPLDRRVDSPALRFSLVGLLAFVGLGGVFGGIAMLADPYQAMGMTAHMMSRTPFDTFLVPGLLLLGLVGFVPIVLALSLLGPKHPNPLWAASFGVGLMAWIVTQWMLLDAWLWLQPVIFAVGAAIVVVAAALWLREAPPKRKRTP